MAAQPPVDPIVHLRTLINDAAAAGEPEANAATLATVDAALNRPSVRTIHVHVDAANVRFFVNTRSGKGRQLNWNPQAALCFYWRRLQKQAALEGAVVQLDAGDADRLWRKRTRESALAARVSSQKMRLAEKPRLEERLHEERQRYSFSAVPRPEHWLGYRMLVDRIEFWDTGWHRMRVRQLFERDTDGRWNASVQEP